MKFIIDISMVCLSLILRLLKAGKIERILVYIFQFLSRFETGDIVQKDVFETMRRIGL